MVSVEYIVLSFLHILFKRLDRFESILTFIDHVKKGKMSYSVCFLVAGAFCLKLAFTLHGRNAALYGRSFSKFDKYFESLKC